MISNGTSDNFRRTSTFFVNQYNQGNVPSVSRRCHTGGIQSEIPTARSDNRSLLDEHIGNFNPDVEQTARILPQVENQTLHADTMLILKFYKNNVSKIRLFLNYMLSVHQISLPPQNFVNIIVSHERRAHMGSEGRAATWNLASCRILAKLSASLKLRVISETIVVGRLCSLVFFPFPSVCTV
jgi:hypothetical protein